MENTTQYIEESLAQKDQIIAELHSVTEEQGKTIVEISNAFKKQSQALEDLQRQLRNFQIQFFGSTSEKQGAITETNPNQPFLDFGEGAVIEDEASDDSEGDKEEGKSSDSNQSSQKKKSGNSQARHLSFPENAEEETLVLDNELEKYDPVTGKEFPKIGEEITRKLVLIPGRWKILKIVRPIYGAKDLGVVKAELPKSILGYSKIDESIVAAILVMRFCDHLPYYRIEEIFSRDGFCISRKTINKIALQVGAALLVLAELLKQEILKLSAIYVDETKVKMQNPEGKGKMIQAWMWTLCGIPPDKRGVLAWMDFHPNRNHENADKLIDDYDKIVHSDAYKAYENLADAGLINWAPCWVHARRYFIKATEGAIQKKAIKLFTTVMHADNQGDEMSAADRLAHRQQKVKPLVEKLEKYLEEIQCKPQVLMSKSLTTACNYFLKRKKHFRFFLENADAYMENNTAERVIRPFTIGRKNWGCIGSEEAGEKVAALFSLMQSARNFGLNAKDYIENVMRRLPNVTEENLHELLPQNWQMKENSISPYLPPEYRP